MAMQGQFREVPQWVTQMEEQSGEVPQWVRDFITERRKRKPEEKIGQASHGTYLLCPFSQGEVEAIRNGVWKLREEAFLAIAQRNRELREAGQIVPDSGFSLIRDPIEAFLYERHFRQLLHIPLSLQEMRMAVVEHYGWKEWSDDPWGDFPKFCQWLKSVSNDERQIWAANETFGGRLYLTYWILEVLSHLNYSEITEEDLLTYIGIANKNFLLVESYTGGDILHHKYLIDPIPPTLINEEIIKLYPTRPFDDYMGFIAGILLWPFLIEELSKRVKGHPELEAFLSYDAAINANHPNAASLCEKLVGKDYHSLDKNQAWGKLKQALNKRLYAIAADYDDVYPLRSEHAGMVLKESYLAAEEGLFNAVNYWQLNIDEALISGLKGQLDNRLLGIVKRDLIDAARKAYREHETCESQINAQLKARRKDPGKNDDTSFFDIIPAPNAIPEGQIHLKSLNLNLDKLTPTELQAIERVYQGLDLGYDLNSKTGNSLIQYLGNDYQKTMKAFNRAVAKLRKS